MSIAALQADCKRMIAQIRHLKNDELHNILTEDAKLEELLQNIDQSYLKDIALEKETLLASNASFAEITLAREPELVEGREKIVTLSQQGEQLATTIREKYDEIKHKMGDMSLETTLALLQTSASEMEEESDKLAQRFLNGEMDLDDFLEQFQTRRKIMHLRLVKAEKLTKILSRDPLCQNYMNAPPMALNANYYPGIPQRPPGEVPYPLTQFNMPMPGVNFYQNHY